MKVRKLQSIEDLIFESDMIKKGDDIRMAQSGTTMRPEEGLQQMDNLLDYFINMDDSTFAEKLEALTTFTRTFGQKATAEYILTYYFSYVRSSIRTLTQRIAEELSAEVPDDEKITSYSRQVVAFAARIEKLFVIYEKFKAVGHLPNETDKVLAEILKIKSEFANAYVSPIKVNAERAKSAYSEFEKAETGDEKAKAAKKIFVALDSAISATDGYPKEVQDGLNQVNDYYVKKVEEEVGKEIADQIRNDVYADKDSVAMLRDIFAYQHGSWSNKKQIADEAHKLRTRINGMKLASQEAKVWLTALTDSVEKDLISRLESKQFDTSKFKGIHYDFEKKLPLFEKTPLPVTGKQIADETKIMKFRKAIQSAISLIFGPGTNQTKEEIAWYQTGKFIHDIYAKTLNKSAKLMGKAIGGREGEMKADAVSRLFIPQTKVVDEPKSKQVSEMAVAPGGGTSPQVPAAIGGMGPIKAPTQTTIGSGDQFQSVKKTKKKKKNKKRNLFVLEFNEFIKNIK